LTEPQVRKVMTILKSNYPQSFINMTPEMGRTMLATWCIALASYPANKVIAALLVWIFHQDTAFAPTIGQLCHKIETMPIYMYQQIWPELFKGAEATPIGPAASVQIMIGEDKALLGDGHE
jgi:hypothetical protein